VSEVLAEREQRVTPLELFFDLVFVFAFTQVTTVLSDDPTWRGLGHGLLILGALWWPWASFAWLTNSVDPDETLVWGSILIASAAMFVAALAVPEAFGAHGVVFGAFFLVVVVMFLAVYALAAHGDRALLGAIKRIAPLPLAGGVLILAAGFVSDGLRSLLWLGAIAIGFFGPLFTGLEGWRLHVAHFVERHGLIVIIAIGESLVAIGIGARVTNLSAAVIVAAVLGLGVAAAFWLAYFDFFPAAAQRVLEERRGTERVALARDLYTYLHLPIVAGIVLFAFAMKKTLAHVGDELDTVPAVALCGGPALMLLAFWAMRARISRTLRLTSGRLIAGVVCLLLIPVATAVPALAALALVAAVWVALHAYELIWWRESRAEVRASRSAAPA
jgi:low temperature requirement protein LtrA